MASSKLHALDAAEHAAILRLDGIIVTDSSLYRAAASVDPRDWAPWFAALAADPPERILCGDDPRLLALPERPTLVDDAHVPLWPSQRRLQSARLVRAV